MSGFLHGVRLSIDNKAYIERRILATDIIGTVCTAEDADPAVFPLDRCVLVLDVREALKKAGTTGTLASTLKGIDAEVRTPIVVVRTSEGATDVETYANIIGKIDKTTDEFTGLKALELASTQVGLTPRIFGIAKYDQNEGVTKALYEHAQNNYGFAYSSISHMESISDALVYRQKFSHDCGMMFYGDLIKFDTELAMETEHYAIPQILGKRAKLDQEKGWHYSISNKPLNGVLGLTKEVTYNPINGYGTGANTLNEMSISCLVRDNGFRTWGNRTAAGTDSSMLFEVYTRSSQVVAITLGNLLKDMLQDEPISRSLLERFKQRGDGILYNWRKDGAILGGEINLDPDQNSEDDLMSGRPDWAVDLTAIPPIESPGLKVQLTDKFIMNAVGGLNV